MKLIWQQDFPSRYEALSAELTVKKWSRAKKEGLAAADWVMVSFFAKPPRERVSTSLDTNGIQDKARSSSTRPVRVERRAKPVVETPRAP